MIEAMPTDMVAPSDRASSTAEAIAKKAGLNDGDITVVMAARTLMDTRRRRLISPSSCH